MTSPQRIVVKLGTGVLTSGPGRLDTDCISRIAAQLAEVRRAGTEVIVVSSGAVGLGLGLLGLAKRPRDLSRIQACAATGQSHLMQLWQEAFAPHALTVSQVLLTHEDLRARTRHLGVKETLRQLIGYGTIPIINENDAVSAAELKFGDNDMLSAMVASLVHAQHLVILSTVPGLVDLRGTGQIVPVVERVTAEIEALAGGTTSETGTGGMVSKLAAAKLATRAGCGVFIASGAEPGIVTRLLAGEGPGTFFVPSGLPMESRKRWLAWFHRPAATIQVNADAVPVLRDQGRSLLAVGVVGVTGEFSSGEIVNIAGPDGAIFARGKACFSSVELRAIAGRRSADLKAQFPSRKRLEVVHRNDLALL